MALTTEYSASQTAAFNLKAVAEALNNRFACYRVYRKTYNELFALSNRELADLGLHRSSLRRVAYQAAYEAGA
ncbi:DUF1127 domain-containing protein [Primorskyibacter sp. S87]|uniref:DUF1127 domain-containing protein n=1 Tax=Primorskyibacter sp. S87 TaxID=3415126 RepID=UPI003C7ED111